MKGECVNMLTAERNVDSLSSIIALSLGKRVPTIAPETANVKKCPVTF
jgi:hypothetical protein